MTRTVTHATAAHVAAPAPAATAAPAAPAAEPSPAATSQSAVQPVVDLNSKPAKPATTASSAAPRRHDHTVPIAAGGVLALLAIGSAAVAMNRRRHDDEEEWVEDESIEHEPMEGTAVAHGEPMLQEEQPAMIAPPVSAFGWDNSERSADIRAEEPMVEQDDRKPGETWVERAYRGPSPLNPSVSLKTRLRRAAFFDKRERQAAEGLAAPVDPTAGLPDRMVEERQAELA